MSEATEPKGEHIPIAEAQGIAERHDVTQVIILARRPGEGGIEHLVTYGVDMEHSAAAAEIGRYLKHKVMGWPEGDDAEVGARVCLARRAPKMRDALRAITKLSGPTTAGRARTIAREALEDAEG